MKRKRRICVVTGSRADYGLLYWLMKEIAADADCELQIAVTGMHLSPEFGLTYRGIEADGFKIAARVESLLSSDSAAGIAKSIGLGVIGFADAFASLRPDVIVVLGDRFETFAAAQAALVARIPLAHIAGGDVTEGAIDEALRHCITKMAHLHFVTNERSAQRVRQLGESPTRIFNFGSPGIDYIRRVDLLSRNELEQELGLRFGEKNVLVTFHPATLESRTPTAQFGALLRALKKLPPERITLIFTKPNADAGGRALIEMLNRFAQARENVWAFTSLGQQRYLSLMNEVDVIAGNSSSGLYEAPSFGIPTVNIGDRQKGRLQASSVINCTATELEIHTAVSRALNLKRRAVRNPYGDGRSSRRILAQLKRVRDASALVKKRFFDYPR